MTWEQFQAYLVTGIQDGSIYALIGLGFTIIYAVTNIINFAQGEFVMLGGMCSYMLVDSVDVPTFPTLVIALLCSAAIAAFVLMTIQRRLRWITGIPILLLIVGLIPSILFLYDKLAADEIPVVIASILPILMVAAVGGIMYLIAIHPARRPTAVSLIIITIGAAFFIRGVAGELWGDKTHRTVWYWDHPSVQILDAYVHTQIPFILGSMIIIAILLHLFFSRTMLGKSLKACAINPVGAGLMGINPKMMALIAFVLAAAVGGTIGAVMTPKIGMNYEAGFLWGLYGFIAAALGGFKSQTGAIIGGFLLGIGRSLVIGIDWGPFNSEYKDVWPMVLLMLILLIRSGKLAEEERLG